MIDKGKTLKSFYRLLRSILDQDTERLMFIYFRDGRRVMIVVEVRETDGPLKLIKKD